MKKKVLIYYPESHLKPVGGPAGYLWNLKQGLAKNACSEVDIEFYKNSPDRFENNVALKEKIPTRIVELRRAIDYSFFLRKKFPMDLSINNYDIIHFHWTEEMYLNREFLEQYKGKVILTSHTPCAMHKEKIDRLNPKDYRHFKRWIDKLEEIDKYAFSRADYVFFPCEQAEEPYYHTWANYPKYKDANKYRYIPTGIIGCTAKVGKSEYRSLHGIPDDAFVISYAGRHNEIKGYSDLKEMGKKILDKYPNVYFLIAGKEEPLKGLDHERWIEIGWTTDPHSLISASDVFVLPNKETFFDLILLEVMSLGTPVVMSNTGGNKYFSSFNSRSLITYDTHTEAIEAIESFMNMSMEEMAETKKEELSIFNSRFTVDTFAKNYISLLKDILKEA